MKPNVTKISVRRFLQKTENRKPTGKNRKNRVNRVFLKIRSKIETTVKKDTTRYSDSRKILNVRCFEDVIKFQTNSLQFFVCKCQNVIQLHQTRIKVWFDFSKIPIFLSFFPVFRFFRFSGFSPKVTSSISVFKKHRFFSVYRKTASP